jgi:hypothetical protein
MYPQFTPNIALRFIIIVERRTDILLPGGRVKSYNQQHTPEALPVVTVTVEASLPGYSELYPPRLLQNW